MNTAEPNTGVWILILLVFAAVMFALGYIFRSWLMSRHLARSQQLETENTRLKGELTDAWDARREPDITIHDAPEDLQTIEGIGPKIASLLSEHNIDSLKKLAVADVKYLKEILEKAGGVYRAHDPATWPYQARLATEGKWQELNEYQSVLHGGREY